MAEKFDRVVDHRPDQCSCCGILLASEFAAAIVSEHDTIELPDIKPFVERHRRLKVICPSRGTHVAVPVPIAAKALSYERLQRGPTNNACERALRPAVIQRKVTNGYRAMWAAKGVVDTVRLKPGANTFRTVLQTVTA